MNDEPSLRKAIQVEVWDCGWRKGEVQQAKLVNGYVDEDEIMRIFSLIVIPDGNVLPTMVAKAWQDDLVISKR